jgi:hypothetical protein
MRLDSTDTRGQTLQDYVAGVSILIIGVIFVFSIVPLILSPYQSPIDADQTAISKRVAIKVVDTLTVARGVTQINETRVTDYFSPAAEPADADALRDRYDLEDDVQINVTVQTAESRSDETIGDAVGDHAVAATTRIVTDGGYYCRPTCRVIVRVW